MASATFRRKRRRQRKAKAAAKSAIKVRYRRDGEDSPPTRRRRRTTNVRPKAGGKRGGKQPPKAKGTPHKPKPKTTSSKTAGKPRGTPTSTSDRPFGSAASTSATGAQQQQTGTTRHVEADAPVAGQDSTSAPNYPGPSQSVTSVTPSSSGEVSTLAAAQEQAAYRRAKARYEAKQDRIEKAREYAASVADKHERQRAFADAMAKENELRKPEKPASMAAEEVEAKLTEDVGRIVRRNAEGFMAATEHFRDQLAEDTRRALVADELRKRYGVDVPDILGPQKTGEKIDKALSEKRDDVYRTRTDSGQQTAAEAVNKGQARARGKRAKEEFVHEKRAGEQTLDFVIPVYRKRVVRQAARAERQALARRQGIEVDELSPTQVRWALKQGREYGEREVDQTKHFAEKYGAVPEMGAPFWKRVRQAAAHAPSDDTRRDAQSLLRRRHKVEIQSRGQWRTDPETGKIVLLTPSEKTQQDAKEVARRQERQAEAYEEAHPSLFSADWWKKGGEQIVQAVKDSPQSFAEMAEVAFEIGSRTATGPDQVISALWNSAAKSDGHTAEDVLPRSTALVEETLSSDPTFQLIKNTIETGSISEGGDKTKALYESNPLGVMTDMLTAVTAGGGMGFKLAFARKLANDRSTRATRPVSGSTKAGSREIRALQTARPGKRIDAEDFADRHAERSISERRAYLKKQRDEARRRQDVGTDKVGTGGGNKQSYSRSRPIRGYQKAKEEVASLRGKDPFAPTGKAAIKAQDKFNKKIARQQKAAGSVTKGVAGKTGNEILKNSKGDVNRTAFELVSSGAIPQVGPDVPDYIAAVRAQYAKDTPDAATRAANEKILDELQANYDKWGNVGGGSGGKLRQAVDDAAVAFGDIERQLQAEGHHSDYQARHRLTVQALVQRGEVVYVKKGEALPGEKARAARKAEAEKGREERQAKAQEVEADLRTKRVKEDADGKLVRRSEEEIAKERETHLEELRRGEHRTGKKRSTVRERKKKVRRAFTRESKRLEKLREKVGSSDLANKVAGVSSRVKGARSKKMITAAVERVRVAHERGGGTEGLKALERVIRKLDSEMSRLANGPAWVARDVSEKPDYTVTKSVHARPHVGSPEFQRNVGSQKSTRRFARTQTHRDERIKGKVPQESTRTAEAASDDLTEIAGDLKQARRRRSRFELDNPALGDAVSDRLDYVDASTIKAYEAVKAEIARLEKRQDDVEQELRQKTRKEGQGEEKAKPTAAEEMAELRETRDALEAVRQSYMRPDTKGSKRGRGRKTETVETLQGKVDALAAQLVRIDEDITEIDSEKIKTAERSGYVYVDWRDRPGEEQFVIVPEEVDPRVAYFAPGGVREGATGDPELRQAESASSAGLPGMTNRAMGKSDPRAMLEARANLLGYIRMMNAMISVSPYKRAMSAREARRIMQTRNARKGGMQYEMVAAGRSGKTNASDIGPDDWDAMRQADDRFKDSDQVYLVPKGTKDLFDEMHRRNGLLVGAQSWLTQRYVMAVLPFSVAWHAGNVTDQATRLLISGATPKDYFLWREIEKRAGDQPWWPTLNAHLQGHLGSQAEALQNTRFSSQIAGSRYQGFVRATRALGDTAVGRALRVPGQVPQAGFNVATRIEKPFVSTAKGQIARQLLEERGVLLRDAKALSDEFLKAMESPDHKLRMDVATEFGSRVTGIVGDYSRGWGVPRDLLSAVDPFWTWVRESVKLVAFTLPVKHPVKAALALQLSAIQARVHDELGLPDTMALDDFLKGAVPWESLGPGWMIPTTPYTSFGEVTKMLSEPLEYVLNRPYPYANKLGGAALARPWYDTFTDAVLKHAQTGEPLMGKLPPGMSRKELMLNSVMENFAPGFQQAQTIASHGGFRGNYSGLMQALLTDRELSGMSKVPLYLNPALNPFAPARDLELVGKRQDEREERQEQGKPLNKVQQKRADIDYVQKHGAPEPPEKVQDRARNGLEYVHRVIRMMELADQDPEKSAHRRDTNKPKPSNERVTVQQLREGLTRDGISPSKEAVKAYLGASEEYGVAPEILVGIHSIESAFSTLEGAKPGGTSSAGALGPMQFMPDTWGDGSPDAWFVPVDADGDGEANVYSEADAIYSAAKYLKQGGYDGTEQGVHDALFSYNHADWYVDDVLERARAAAPAFQAAGNAKLGDVQSPRQLNSKPVPKRILKQHVKLGETKASEAADARVAPKDVYDVVIGGFSPAMQRALVTLSKNTGTPVQVTEGYRTAARAQDFASGLASEHHSGMAIDMLNVADYSPAQLDAAGLYLPYPDNPNEFNHFELKNPSGPSVAPRLGGKPAVSPVRGTPEIIGTPYSGTHTLGNWQSDNAVDVALPTGTKIRAAVGGVVDKVDGDNSDPSSRFNGFAVTIDGQTFYTHLSSTKVAAGDRVHAGEVIGRSGVASGVEHLHFGILEGDPQAVVMGEVSSLPNGVSGAAVTSGVATSTGTSTAPSVPAANPTAEVIKQAKKRKSRYRRRVSYADRTEYALALLRGEMDVVEYAIAISAG